MCGRTEIILESLKEKTCVFSQKLQNITGWWFFTNPSEKYAQVKMTIFPEKFRGENSQEY